MATIQIIEVTGTELYRRYAGQTSAQPAQVSLDCATGALTAEVNPEVGNAVPARQWCGHVQCWAIPALKEDAANTLLHEVAQLARRVVDGYAVEWDGHNHVALFSEDADEARDGIATLCDRASLCESNRISVWGACEWFAGLGSLEARAKALSITADTTDEELATIKTQCEAEAAGEGADVIEGLVQYLRALRTELNDRDD